jgi:hypothetical protein
MSDEAERVFKMIVDDLVAELKGARKLAREAIDESRRMKDWEKLRRVNFAQEQLIKADLLDALVDFMEARKEQYMRSAKSKSSKPPKLPARSRKKSSP